MSKQLRLSSKSRSLPPYRRVIEAVEEAVARGDYALGDRLPSLKEMAEQLDVHFLTVRKAMLELARRGITEMHVGVGTFIASTPVAAVAPPVARHVAIWTEFDIAEPRLSGFYSRTIQKMQVFLESHGLAWKLYWGRRKPWEQIVSTTASTCPGLWEDLAAGRVMGVVALGASAPWVKHLDEQKIPVVGWGDQYTHKVTMDYARLVRDAAELLVKNGRRKIALLQWWSPESAVRQSDPTLAAFETALRENDVPVVTSWIRHDLEPSIEGAGWAEFREIWTASRSKPDGLIVTDDLLYRDAAMAILSMGIRVPEDLMVVTHANKGSGVMYPFPTVRVEMDLDETVEIMGGLLLKHLQGAGEASSYRELPVRWIFPASNATDTLAAGARRAT